MQMQKPQPQIPHRKGSSTNLFLLVIRNLASVVHLYSQWEKSYLEKET